MSDWEETDVINCDWKNCEKLPIGNCECMWKLWMLIGVNLWNVES